MSSTVERITFTEKLADRLISRERYAEDEETYLKVKYGVEVILINVIKISLVYILALLIGVFWETLITHLAFVALRRYSFGLHAVKSLNCTITSLLMFVLGPFLFQSIPSTNWIVVIVFALVLFNMFRYAPSDTESLPLIGLEERNILKKKAMVCTIVLFLITLLVPSAEMKTLIMLGSVYQVISIHPLMYKLLNRRYRNYESYE
ncbi:regulator [Listeria fleischmannii 1991]|uniref:Putative AgrB-like protein n=2 Tax=Listeria fleischmannii TaxID=1069827 RepID=A0A2X3HBX4_9LIST|nr:accessory gene regulator B family protein [Listeria fleischmannii]EMG28257.1 regulator [Listeria fleischmannii subsp. fleischmannii LU2006-1]KMT60068.1 regulator [Listeria fleischmannii 1991]SQC68734.1 Accessory gene regulator protein B [Listeria fleischmannii subsp. fleischmannii]